MIDIDRVRALTFDVVGTLIDFEAGILAGVRSFADDPDDETLLAAFAAAEDVQQQRTPQMPFTAMLDPISTRLAVELGIPQLDGRSGPSPLRRSIGNWPAFPDAVAALARLRNRFRLVAVTNADLPALEAMSTTLGEPFDDTVTVDVVGANKPDPRMFRAALDRLADVGIGREEVVHVAQSQYHDIGAARGVGLATCWVERRHGRPGSGATPTVPLVRPDVHVHTVDELVRLLVGPEPRHDVDRLPTGR